MQRKLISQGGGGSTIYLPKKWVDRKGLKPGSKVEIKDKGHSLIISSTSGQSKEIVIELNDDNRHDLRTILTHIYRQGFDKATIKGTDSKTVTEIRKDCHDYLLGFEVSEAGKSHCIIESISEPSGEKYEILLRRVFLIIKEMMQLVEEDIQALSFIRKTEENDLKVSLDKYVLFCRRSITKEKMDMDNPMLEWELLTFLMHIGHALHYTYTYAAQNKCGKANMEYLKGLGAYFDLLYDAHYGKDLSKVHKMNRIKKEIVFTQGYEAVSSSKGKEAIIAAQIKEVYRLVQIASSPVLGMILHSKLEATDHTSS